MFFFIIWLSMVSHCISQVQEYEWKKDHLFNSYMDTKYTVFLLHDVSLLSCAKSCGEVVDCLSFFYNKPGQICRGVSIEYWNPNNLLYESDTIYFKDILWAPTTIPTTTTTTTVTTTAMTTTTQQTSGTCPGTYTYHAALNLCWRLCDGTLKSWQDARTECIAQGGDLIVLKTNALVDYMKAELTAVGAGIVYVGASDQAVEGEYLWIDGTSFGGTWGADQPNNLDNGHEDQDCLLMESAFGYDFSDIHCSNQYKFLCQIIMS